MNAIDFLIQEHNKVRKLFSDLNDPSHREDTKKKIYETLHNELVRHEAMEQTVWYPELKSNKELLEEIKHLITEERSAKKLMTQLSKMKTSPDWEKELPLLQEEVEHHASEEESELFPIVNKLYENNELERIGKEMRDFKENYKEK